MKLIAKIGREYVLRFDYGEDFLLAFARFLAREKISGSFFYGLGGLIDPEIAFYDLKKKKYLIKKFKGDYEVAGFSGNSAMKGQDVAIHCHLVLGAKNYRAFAGHLVTGKVAGTLEIYLFRTPKLNRHLDKKTGLNLLNK